MFATFDSKFVAFSLSGKVGRINGINGDTRGEATRVGRVNITKVLKKIGLGRVCF